MRGCREEVIAVAAVENVKCIVRLVVIIDQRRQNNVVALSAVEFVVLPSLGCDPVVTLVTSDDVPTLGEVLVSYSMCDSLYNVVAKSPGDLVSCRCARDAIPLEGHRVRKDGVVAVSPNNRVLNRVEPAQRAYDYSIVSLTSIYYLLHS